MYVIITQSFIFRYFSFLIIFVLPLDVSSTAYRQCLNQSSIPLLQTTTINPLNTVHSVITENDINKTRYAPKFNLNQVGNLEKCEKPYSLLGQFTCIICMVFKKMDQKN